MASSLKGDVLAVPVQKSIYIIDGDSGERIDRLNVHIQSVTAVHINETYSELYSAGLDGQIIAYAPKWTEKDDETDEDNEDVVNEDEWTDDDDDE